MSDFCDLVDVDALPPDERARLQRVHDLLVQAGPPPDLPPSLAEPPTRGQEAEIVQFPLLPRRRWAVGAVVAAALALVAFAGGYLLGHHKGERATTFTAERVVPMHGQDATAILRIAKRDSAGNWPMQVEVVGLPKQRDPRAYYELWLTRHGTPAEPCGQFRVHGGTTRVAFSVPWDFEGIDGWVVTKQARGETSVGTVVLTT